MRHASRGLPAPLRGGRQVVAVLAIAFAGLLLLPAAALAATPTVSVKPESGGPGTPLTVSGSGFCARPACGPVRLTISGRQLAADQRPGASGSFAARAQAPGGLTPGEHEIVATQTLDDGNEISASALFVYSPSRGEEAEREAESRDAVTNLVDSSAPTAPPRGIPLASAAAQLTGSQPSPASASPAAAGAAAADRTDDGVPVVLVLSIAAAVAALMAGAVWWRRRSLGGTS